MIMVIMLEGSRKKLEYNFFFRFPKCLSITSGLCGGFNPKSMIMVMMLKVFLKSMEFCLWGVFKYYVITLGGTGYIPKFLYGELTKPKSGWLRPF